MTLDREQVARTRRRQEALDSLAFEREREAALERLDPEDATVLREISFVLTEPPEDARGRFEARIAELEAQIEDSRRRQKAFAAYTQALEA